MYEITYMYTYDLKASLKFIIFKAEIIQKFYKDSDSSLKCASI